MVSAEKTINGKPLSLHCSVYRLYIRSQLKRRHLVSLREYLEENGLLIDFDDPALTDEKKRELESKIEEAKATHRRLYLKNKQEKYRKSKVRVEMTLDKEESALIKKRAGKKRPGTFIKEMALAYMKQEYIIPNEEIIEGLIKEIARYREDRNREGRNVKQILDWARKRGMVEVPEDIEYLREKLYSLDKLDYTFHLEETVMNALRHPEEQFPEYLKRKLHDSPELIEETERILAEIKHGHGHQGDSDTHA
jgi:hypothetical protein